MLNDHNNNVLYTEKIDLLDFNSVKKFLELGGDPNDFLDTESPIIFQILLKFHIKSRGKFKFYEKNCFEIIRLLLNSGANPNIKGVAGLTALGFAVVSLKLTKLLLDNGADINARAFDNTTPLYNCDLMSTDKKAIKLLLDHGPDTTIPRFDGSNVLFKAVTGKYQILRMILQKNDCIINLPDDDKGNTVLHFSVLNPPFSFKKIALLLKHGADIHASNRKGITPFQIVFKYGSPIYLKLQKLFLKYHANYPKSYRDCLKLMINKEDEIDVDY